MAKYYGKIGFAITYEKADSVWDSNIEERYYAGDVIRLNRRYESKDKINDDVNISNSISILADVYAMQNFQFIRYVTWMGAKWKVNDVEVNYPRLVLSIGGLYNEQDET